jgi:hypothetical protein
MALLVLIVLILLIVTGSLLTVLKVALGVAVGLVLAIVAISLLFAWWIRRRWRAALAGAGSPPASLRGSSTVEVLPPRRPTPGEHSGPSPPTVIDVSPVDGDDPSGSG